MQEQELLKYQTRNNLLVFRRNRIYTQKDIDEKKFVPYTLCDVLEHPANTKITDIHKFTRDYLNRNGNKSCVYFIITKFGNYKYVYNRRPNDKTFQNTIKFSPKKDGECDIVYKQDIYYLEHRWRVFNEYVDDTH